MSAPQRRAAQACALGLGLILAGPTWAASLVVEVQGFGSGVGNTYVGVCATALDPSGCPYGKQRKAKPGTDTFTFEVPPGAYAIAAYHDENGNRQLDRNGLGLPLEPYAFSNDVGRTAPPTLSGARVQVGPGTTTIVVRVRRLLGD